jgi:RNase H-fold protein (predicted Holliday junction resolvase)
VLLGFDPGRDKCGLAVMASDRTLLFQSVVSSKNAIAQIDQLLQTYPISLMVMGDQTSAKEWKSELKVNFPNLHIVSIDERFSSQEARQRYWLIYPAQGLSALMPMGLRTPPRAIDDIVAIILIERYLNQLITPMWRSPTPL